jgi:hypothetical protein
MQISSQRVAIFHRMASIKCSASITLASITASSRYLKNATPRKRVLPWKQGGLSPLIFILTCPHMPTLPSETDPRQYRTILVRQSHFLTQAYPAVAGFAPVRINLHSYSCEFKFTDLQLLLGANLFL